MTIPSGKACYDKRHFYPGLSSGPESESDRYLMATRNNLTVSLLFPALVAGLVTGCSGNGSSSSSTVAVTVQAGQEDLDNALIRSITITEAGLPNEDAEGRNVYSQYVTDAQGAVSATIASEEVQLFQVVGRIADADKDLDATTVRCQWVAGCSADGTSYSFGTDVARIDGLGWRSVVYDASKNERVRLTPLTDLAAQLAFDYVYNESADAGDTSSGVADVTVGWTETGYYSAYSVEQAVSQVSKVFGITSVQNAEPADLTQIGEWTRVSAGSQDSIRYGALLSAWNHLAESYSGDFTSAVAAEFSADKGQVLEKSNTLTRVLTLNDLYQAAITNLQALSISNTSVQANVTAVITGLQADVSALTEDTFTSQVPASLTTLLGSSNYDDFVLGIKRTKAFVEVMRNYNDTFFEDGYKAQVDSYVDMLKAVGNDNAANLDAIVKAFHETEQLYLATVLADSGNSCADISAYSWATQCSFNASTEIMTLNNGAITVSQMVADVNTTDSDDSPTSSNAIDVLIKGTYTDGTLRFDVDNTYTDDDPTKDITSSSGVRVYYTTAVSGLADPAGNEIIGYEIRWSDFSLTDTSGSFATENGVTAGEVTGSFRLFYRGVRDPLDSNSALHFNIDTAVLNGRISDVVGDDSDSDKNYTTLYVAGSATNASDFYPEKEFASFNGFFTPNASAGFTKGDTISNLLTYQTGSETLSGQDVQYLDVQLMANGEHLDGSRRYRFYPTVQRADVNDLDGDGDTDELVATHDIEICEYGTDKVSGNWVMTGCLPKQRLYSARDVQQAINDLWEAGVFSRIQVPGRGTYFVTWPATLTDGCYALDSLMSGATSLPGELYDPMVLGLTSARLTTEVNLSGEPDSLLDIAVTAETAERYSVTAGLSHDYSSITSSTVYLGTGSSLDRILFSYDTDSSFSTTGSVAIYKDGVSLTLEDGTTSTVDSSLTAFLKQAYNPTPLPYKYVNGSDGNYDLCVTANQAEVTNTTALEDSVFYLNFRDVVYGRIRQENGVWVIRYIDGSWELL